MIVGNTELMQYIREDLQKYEGFRHFQKASILERLFVKNRPPQMLHPNPEDEFSMPSIGPHFGIVNEYCTRIASPYRPADGRTFEPLIVEKMTRGGYMLLNGHHRWAAGLKMGVKSLPIKIVNLTHEEDHIRMMEKTKNVKRVTFDFDEVLCTTEAHPKAEENPKLFLASFEKIFKERLRWGAPALIQELRSSGYDVWVYTSSFESEEYLRGFFKAYKTEIDGIINGTGRKKSKKAEQDYRDMVAKKYNLIYNIDNDSVLRIRPSEKDFESFDLQATDSDWANKVMEAIKSTAGED